MKKVLIVKQILLTINTIIVMNGEQLRDYTFWHQGLKSKAFLACNRLTSTILLDKNNSGLLFAR